jgi:hypothetical protein
VSSLSDISKPRRNLMDSSLGDEMVDIDIVRLGRQRIDNHDLGSDPDERDGPPRAGQQFVEIAAAASQTLAAPAEGKPRQKHHINIAWLNPGSRRMRLEESETMNFERPAQFVDYKHTTTFGSARRNKPARQARLHQRKEVDLIR